MHEKETCHRAFVLEDALLSLTLSLADLIDVDNKLRASRQIPIPRNDANRLKVIPENQLQLGADYSVQICPQGQIMLGRNGHVGLHAHHIEDALLSQGLRT